MEINSCSSKLFIFVDERYDSSEDDLFDDSDLESFSVGMSYYMNTGHQGQKKTSVNIDDPFGYKHNKEKRCKNGDESSIGQHLI